MFHEPTDGTGAEEEGEEEGMHGKVPVVVCFLLVTKISDHLQSSVG